MILHNETNLMSFKQEKSFTISVYKYIITFLPCKYPSSIVVPELAQIWKHNTWTAPKDLDHKAVQKKVILYWFFLSVLLCGLITTPL
jgi:hypothetical protein